MLDGALAGNIVSKSGAYLSFGDTRLGNGREAAKQFLRENKDVCAALEKAVRAADVAMLAGDGGDKEPAGTEAEG